jgi:hypothetical protein
VTRFNQIHSGRYFSCVQQHYTHHGIGVFEVLELFRLFVDVSLIDGFQGHSIYFSQLGFSELSKDDPSSSILSSNRGFFVQRSSSLVLVDTWFDSAFRFREASRGVVAYIIPVNK